jgi:inosine/xanthosine triphosphatase
VIIHIGSTRPAKIDGVRQALDAIARIDPRFTESTVIPHDLTGIAPRQPMSLAEILDGARSRAAALPGRGEPGTFAIGLEGGLHQLPGDAGWSLQSWAAVTNGAAWGFGAGPALTVPPPIVERVLAGEELGDVIDRLVQSSVRGTRGAWGVLTRDAIGRGDAFRLAAIAAFAPFFNPVAYKNIDARS